MAMCCKPITMKELNEITTMRYIRALIVDEKNKLTNIYSPQSKALDKLYYWVCKNIPDERLHDK